EPRAREVEVGPEVDKARQDLHEILDVPDARRDLYQVRGREPDGVVGADDRPNARSGDHVDGDSLAVEDLEDADVREPPGGAAAERDPDAPPCHVAGETGEGS